jgi:hypothetical protein
LGNDLLSLSPHLLGGVQCQGIYEEILIIQILLGSFSKVSVCIILHRSRVELRNDQLSQLLDRYISRFLAAFQDIFDERNNRASDLVSYGRIALALHKCFEVDPPDEVQDGLVEAAIWLLLPEGLLLLVKVQQEIGLLIDVGREQVCWDDTALIEEIIGQSG